jgi:hypothetical protein
MSRVFINYRRSDSSAHANLLYDWVRERYGEDRVFKDVDTIEPGLDFVEAIERAVASSEVMLVVIGKEWVVDAQGRRRLEDVDDYVAMEISAALNGDLRVIPVLVEGAKMPTAVDLPESLAALPRRHAFELSDARSRIDRAELLQRLDVVLGAPNGNDRAPAAAPAAPLGEQSVAAMPRTQQAPAPAHFTPAPAAAGVAAAPVPAPVSAKPERTKSLVKWAWILVAGSALIPFLAIGAAVLGALVISRGEGKKTGMGIAIIVSASIVGLFAASYWIQSGA